MLVNLFCKQYFCIPNIPSRYNVETKGISIKQIDTKDNKEDEEIKGICILDSEGIETPLLKEENDKPNNEEQKKKLNDKNKDDLGNAIKYDEIEDDLSRDKEQTERFI